MDDAQNQQQLADDLRDAFAEVARAALPQEEKARWQQRLLAITNSSKRDVVRARASLQRFNDDWRRTHSS